MTTWFDRFTRHARRLLGADAASPASPPDPPPAPAPPPERLPASERSAILHARARAVPADAPRRFLLSVDGAGQLLVVAGDRVTIGHVRAARADLPFLADVGPLHAELVRVETLRDGSIWIVRPLEDEDVVLDGQLVPTEGMALGAGARMALGENLTLRFLVPDDASSTVLLEIIGQAECVGARTVALFGAGEGGRLRIGAAEKRHVRVANLEHEIDMVGRGDELLVRCRAGVRAPEGTEARTHTLPFPPAKRIDLQVGEVRDGRPPFALAVSPVDPPGGLVGWRDAPPAAASEGGA